MDTSINVGNKADITLFTANVEHIFSEKDIKSKSSNTPLLGKKMNGIVVGTILNNSHSF